MAAVVTQCPVARRRAVWWVLLAAVMLGHALATLWLRDSLIRWRDAGPVPALRRMEVAFVRVLAPAAPPPAPAPRAVRRPARARAAAPAAAMASAPQVTEPSSPAASEPAAAAAADAASAPAADNASPSAGVASAPAFEWPPSTRLDYVLSGNFRGEVQGHARVQWIRQGSHYQVHLDIEVGPSFAPLIWRRITSDGELGVQGLTPQRYEEATRLPLQAVRRLTMRFTPEVVTLADGSLSAALPGLQDTASQFVQLTWLFTTQPQLLQAGNTVTLPLALPRRVGNWIYDVLGEERLVTPVGEIDAFHLRPRLGVLRGLNELRAEIWIAPILQYLPVRIRVEHDAETFADLLLESAPLQALPQASGPVSAPQD
jgi:hypothetical protein